MCWHHELTSQTTPSTRSDAAGSIGPGSRLRLADIELLVGNLYRAADAAAQCDPARTEVETTGC